MCEVVQNWTLEDPECLNNNTSDSTSNSADYKKGHYNNTEDTDYKVLYGESQRTLAAQEERLQKKIISADFETEKEVIDEKINLKESENISKDNDICRLNDEKCDKSETN